MRRATWLAGAALVLTPALALAGSPESLLPPIFDNPTPTPAPRPSATARPAAPVPAAPLPGATPVIQQLPGDATDPNLLPTVVPKSLPSIAELEKMDSGELDELFGLKPKYDIPPGARRSLEQVGVLGAGEGGFAPGSLSAQPAALVRAALAGTKGPIVSRWGHILLRRALASRLDAPDDMDPVEFAALRATVLNRMGEGAVSRRLVQDVDSANYDEKLASAALDAYLQTGDLVGMCPVAELKGGLREDDEWLMVRAICDAFGGESRTAERDLGRMLSRGTAPRIDVLLAQRFAGAAGEGRRAVNIEWDGVDELTPWRLSLSRALGIEIPDSLLNGASSRLMRGNVLIPAVPLDQRAAAADRAGKDGILSSRAMIDLYSQIFADDDVTGDVKDRSNTLRTAYVAAAPADRVAAIEAVWGGGEDQYGRQVLTAYAAARLPVERDLMSDPSPFIASMLTAGLDRNAMRWGPLVNEGSQAWALLALAQPNRQGTVSSGALSEFIDNDKSIDQRKSRFLVAGLAGLGRIDSGDLSSEAGRLDLSLDRASKWSDAIDKAGEYRNPALVALLAGLGMQGSGWDKMTARHLFHIVRALDRAGLGAEARMIAAEAVARG
ncbi:hypothetical protein GRI89_10995 [Altererythrobacter salegens]|uniref:Antifreeze protein n=1 Tax=Croceibacterium salegens TaxID=1737568 RepID=A0A6I4SVJ7_9SPHN|nr:hypothetical protein [Croceibacterium salegens]MXO60065.1 hypothetical protein [Croceibacterium salegens]